MGHRYSIGQIAGWTLDGVWQWIRKEVPDWIIEPRHVSRGPPGWWGSVKTWGDWYYCVASDGHPQSCWFSNYIDACWKLLGKWIDEAADDVGDAVSGAVRSWVGYVQGGFSNFSDWIKWLQGLTGGYLPWWASSLADAADRLYWWLPAEIRQGYTSWSDLWEGIKASVRDWARARYDDAKAWADGAWQWVLNQGATLKGWYDAAGAWLDDFRQNASERVRGWLGTAWDWIVGFWNDPYGTITGTLGDSWEALKTAARDALPFWYNLWGSYADEIGAFWGDPLGYLYDRVEDFLSDKW
jgi:hypothetical protein